MAVAVVDAEEEEKEEKEEEEEEEKVLMSLLSVEVLVEGGDGVGGGNSSQCRTPPYDHLYRLVITTTFFWPEQKPHPVNTNRFWYPVGSRINGFYLNLYLALTFAVIQSVHFLDIQITEAN